MESRRSHKTEAEIEVQPRVLLDAGNQNLAYNIVIQSLRCPKLLRICRLVCHSWNISACAVLRNINVISFEEITLPSSHEDHENEYIHPLKAFSQFVQHDDFPSPFRKISIEAKLLQPSDFWDCVKQLKLRNIDVTELVVSNTPGSENLGFWDEDRCKCLENILECHQDTLTSLKIYYDEDLPENVIEGLDKFRPISLKKLHLEHSNEGLGEVDLRTWNIFMENILRHSKLMELTIDASNFKMLKEILTSNQLINNVPSLRVATIELTTSNYDEIIQYFFDNPLPNLKHVQVHIKEKDIDLGPLLFTFSNSLEVLLLTGRSFSLESFPVFPNLRELCLYSLHKGEISPEKFPALKKLTCRMTPPPRTSVIIPHSGLDFLDAIITISKYGNDYLEWTNDHNNNHCDLCEKFEKLTAKSSKSLRSYFGIQGGVVCFTVATIRTMQNCFPNLKTLKLWVPDELNFAPGFQEVTTQDYFTFRNQLLLEHLVREIFPLESFLRLESLSTNAKIAPPVIQFSLSRISKLKTLRFDPIETCPQPSAYKTEMLTAFRDYLGHLKEIQARGCKEDLKTGERASILAFGQLNESELLPPGLFRYFCYCVTCRLGQCGCIDCDKFDDLRNPLF